MSMLCAFLACVVVVVLGELPADTKPGIKVDFDGQEVAPPEGNYDIQEEDDVMILIRDNFHHVLSKEKVLLVEFYAPWCGHCKQLAPAYAEAAGKLKEDGIHIAKVDATKETDLAKEYLVSGYPSIMFFKDGEKVEDYEGPRTANGIIEFMKQRADPNWKPPPSQVVELTDETFEKTIMSSPLILVMFYAPWCTHCKKLQPEYSSAAADLKAEGIPLAKIDGNKYKTIADEYEVGGWPTLLIFRYGRKYEYKGQREGPGIISYMKNQATLPSKEVISVKETDNSINRIDISIVGFFKEKTPLYAEYIAAANDLRDHFTFLHTFSPEIIKHYKAKENSVVLYQPEIYHSKHEDKKYVFDRASGSASDLVSFFKRNCIPLVGQRTKHNSEIRYTKRPLLVAYFDVSFSHQYVKDTQFVRNKILEVAKDYKDKSLVFAIADEEEWTNDLQLLGLADSGEDVNIGLWAEKKRFRMNPVDDLQPEDIKEFIADVEAGKIKPFRKSQKAPKKQEGPVKILVADNFESEVLANKKDVLVEFYAPWCGHCKALEPTYKKLAKKMSSDNLVIAKFDATANDLPDGLAVSGFPTLYFFKAFKKDEPEQYQGDRSYKDLKKFVNEHSSIFLTEEEKMGIKEKKPTKDAKEEKSKDEL